MKKIYASNDPTKYALIDDDIYEIIQKMGLKFCIMPNGYLRSTSHSIKLSCMSKKKRLYLHQFVYIIKTKTEPSLTIDHIDINPANNMFENLRLATRQEQQQNQGKQKNNSSGFIGVSHHHKINKYKNKKYENDYWIMSIMKPDGKQKQKLFAYTTEGKIAAAKYYDKKAIEYFGEFHGELNFPDENTKTE